MKLFLSWSGPVSHKIATILRDWLPMVLQSVDPYVSSEDIDKGTRWSTDIAKELEESRYGVICVTHQNVKAPWINFEAGALSKTIDRSNVAPFLFNIKKSEIDGPLVQFQLTIYEKEDVKKLISSINNASDGQRLDQLKVDRTFDQWWPSLEKNLEEVLSECKEDIVEHHQNTAPLTAPTSNEKILEELLELSRLQVKILKSPEELLPPGYLRSINQSHSEENSIDDSHPVWKDLEEAYSRLRMTMGHLEKEGLSRSTEEKDIDIAKFVDLFNSLKEPMEYLLMRYRSSIVRYRDSRRSRMLR